ncbi:vacuolar sorting-associated 72 like [Fusarium sporotrichioides]|uniref:Vacuolar sorting-associated 72 like n=1 Tax=Fusarium sporotrichioides TaxID=5514 RepID=A0A395RTG2_FUSSP|nr:vacuolar sorting-associated 72 like [Fusarium sporotrichioides]
MEHIPSWGPLSPMSSVSSLDDFTPTPSDTASDAEVQNGKSPSKAADSPVKSEGTVEWLATTRERRSTAGNRMKSMLANEEPDSDLELLFAEDENDQGFSEVDENGSDVQMDSSDDEDDNGNNDDDLEGEKELEKQAKERRAAQRKRKAQEAIPAKFRKKVRIDPTTRTPSAPTRPAPRPKKKSERTSWLPSAADLPTRASSRQTTRLSKEQLHQQMVEREERRIKQLAQMQKKAAKLEAMKKPPMTQEERLREAAIVEKRNSKSLNRWEEAEKQREEERRAKLAALHNRTLKGPVITFWSGIGEWMGRHMVIEEPAKEKRKRGEKAKLKDMEKAATVEGQKAEGQNGTTALGDAASNTKEQPAQSQLPAPASSAPSVAPEPKETTTSAPIKGDDCISKPQDSSSTTKDGSPSVMLKTEDANPSLAMPPPPHPPPTPPNGLAAPTLPPSKILSVPSPPPSGLAAPSPPPPTPVGSTSTTSFAAPTSGLSRPPDSKPSGVLAAPILAPPPCIGSNGAVPPMMGFGNPKSNVLAPPNTSQSAMPPTLSNTTPTKNASSDIPGSRATPPTTAIPASSTTNLQPILNSSNLPVKSSTPDNSAVTQAHESQPQPSTGARNAIVFQSFDENALKDRSIQTQIIFGRKMNRLSKPSPAPLCVITNHPARYRDPRTGLHYYNAYAYREIQRLTRGEYRWSHILGAWVGSGTYAARGVPERFLNPEKKGPEKKPAVNEDVKDKDAAIDTQSRSPEIKAPEVTPEIRTPGEKMTGIEQGSSTPPNLEPGKAAQPSTASPAVVGPTNTTNPAAATIPTPALTSSTKSNP